MTQLRWTMDLIKVMSTSAQYVTEWLYAPSYSQWRDGASEACVEMFKSTQHHMTKEGNLTYEKLLCLFSEQVMS